jgi:hypothetical protein
VFALKRLPCEQRDVVDGRRRRWCKWDGTDDDPVDTCRPHGVNDAASKRLPCEHRDVVDGRRCRWYTWDGMDDDARLDDDAVDTCRSHNDEKLTSLGVKSLSGPGSVWALGVSLSVGAALSFEAARELQGENIVSATPPGRGGA